MKVTTLCTLITASALLAMNAQLSQAQDTPPTADSPSRSVVAIAQEAGSFGTLLEAAKTAGMLELLDGEGPITVFAPTDAAFEKRFGHTTVDTNNPDHKAILRRVLAYHVVKGVVPAAKIAAKPGLMTIQGQRIEVEAGSDQLKLGQASIVRTDIKASNGIIHVVDNVMLPHTRSTFCVTMADPKGRFGTFINAMRAADGGPINRSLVKNRSITMFAPTDEAFAKLPEGTLENLLKPENRDQLDALLRNHFVDRRVYTDDIDENAPIHTVQGEPVVVERRDGTTYVNGAKVIEENLDTSNGVVHLVDTVLLPNPDD